MKKILLALIAAVLLIPSVAFAVGPSGPGSDSVYPVDGDCRDRELLSSMTTAKALTANKVTSTTYGRARSIIIQAQTASAMCSWAGTDPTVTGGAQVGFLFETNASFIVPGYGNIGRFKCINASASNGAVVEVVYCY